MDGIILINKPKGLTSKQALEQAKESLGVKKAGHSGTLDPNASGLIIIAFGSALKQMDSLSRLPKEYEGLIHLHSEIPEPKIRAAFKKFTGRITQIPPLRSAVARRPRTREVFYLNLLKSTSKDVHFRIGCEAGTYIRKLASDIGDNLGTRAHLKELERKKIGPFSLEDSVLLKDVKKEKILPIEEVLKELKFFKLKYKE